ncbi:hypothetical protein Bbelb_124350 [Branchiostoma belcheri]|nr:hypothetical protein Bbelb_124350 [Branchiostoma belcheri]
MNGVCSRPALPLSKRYRGAVFVPCRPGPGRTWREEDMKEAGGREEGLAVGLLLLHLVPAVFSNKFMSVTVHGMVGDTVTFPASYDSDKDIIVLTWNKLDQDIEGRRVPVYIYTPVSRTSLALGPLKGRAELHQNGSLTIRKINEADEGHYVMTVLIDTIGQEEQYVFLDIVVPPKVDIGLVGPELVPTNSSLTLNCSVDKTNSKVKAVFWMKDNELLSRDTTRVDYEGPNSYKSSILLEKMTRKDSGNYSCVAEHIRSVVVDSVQNAKQTVCPTAIAPFYLRRQTDSQSSAKFSLEEGSCLSSPIVNGRPSTVDCVLLAAGGEHLRPPDDQSLSPDHCRFNEVESAAAAALQSIV